MTNPPEKILALQFKYFGDAVLLTPALRALRARFPGAEIHLLAPAEITPLFAHLPWLNRVWAMPRRRGSASLRETWPLLRALRRERFSRSVDFASNDRGAILSRLIGAKRRLGWSERGGFLGRRLCYTERVANDDVAGPESARLARLLSGWQVPPPASLESEIRADPALAETARGLLPEDRAVICHAASSQPRKEWPLSHWAALHQLATKAGYHLVFTTARGGREAALMNDLRRLVPGARVLPEIGELALFLAVLARARVFIAGDTGPLHFAAGLGVSTIALFGPTSPDRWAPVGSRHRLLVAGPCTCPADAVVCTSTQHCLANIQPAQVLDLLASAAGGHA